MCPSPTDKLTTINAPRRPRSGVLVQLSESLLRVFMESTRCGNGSEENGRAASGTLDADPARSWIVGKPELDCCGLPTSITAGFDSPAAATIHKDLGAEPSPHKGLLI